MGSRKERSDKDPMREFHPSTAVILAGYRARLSENSVKPPVFRTSTFKFTTAEEGAKFFQRAYSLPGTDGKPPGLMYSRLNNPNVEIFEDKMVAAELGAEHARVFPSGMSAITTMLLALVPSGGKVLYTEPVYGGTYFFLTELGPQRFGITAKSVDTSDIGETERVIKEHGPFDFVLIETPANPTMTITDIAAVAELARRSNPKVIVAVDNTFMGPVFQRPFECGADIVVYSATKFIGGHSDLIAGIVLTKSQEQIVAIDGLRTILGATVAADTAWMLTRSLETVWVRMERQAEKAMKVAHALSRNPKIARVIYPGLLRTMDGASYVVFQKQCSGPGSLLSFMLKDEGREAAFRLLNAVTTCHLAVSLGGTETLIEHPRSMTHSDMKIEDLDKCGITESMIRLSVGLESSEDIIADLEHALDAV